MTAPTHHSPPLSPIPSPQAPQLEVNTIPTPTPPAPLPAPQAPQLDINTVAAGGGSRLHFRSGLFAVGPDSAGAHPGPVCYKKGGHLAVTDANLALGRILPEFFPKIFGPGEVREGGVGGDRGKGGNRGDMGNRGRQRAGREGAARWACAGQDTG